MRIRNTKAILALVIGIVMTLSVALVPDLLPATPVAAQTPAVSPSVVTCGYVSSYMAATSSVSGVITIGGQNYSLAPNTSLNGTAPTVGTSVCLSASVNSSGQINYAVFSPNTTAAANFCGQVSAYTPAGATASGSLTVNGQTFAIAPGATFAGASSLVNAASVCVYGSVNGAGQLVSGTVTTVTGSPAGPSVSYCGIVSGYNAATATSLGSLTIGGQVLSIAANTAITSGAITNGSNVCLTGTLNSSGQLITATIVPNTGTPFTVCGTVSAFAAPTSSAAGSLTINGTTYPIAAGTSVVGPTVTTGNGYCVSATASSGGALSLVNVYSNFPTAFNVCGTATAYTPATATTSGSITISGGTGPIVYSIVSPSSLTGVGTITIGSTYCLQGTVNSANQITTATVTSSTTATPSPTTSVTTPSPTATPTVSGTTVAVCGQVSGYTAATTTAAGVVTVTNSTSTSIYPIAPGTVFTGLSITNLSTYCINGTLNTTGQITGANVTVPLSATVYTPWGRSPVAPRPE